VRILRATSGPNHPDTIEALLRLGLVLAYLDPAVAVPLEERGHLPEGIVLWAYPGTDGRVGAAALKTTRHGTPGGPTTGNRVVPSFWQKPAQNGPMIMAGDKQPTRTARTLVMMSNQQRVETAHLTPVSPGAPQDQPTTHPAVYHQTIRLCSRACPARSKGTITRL